MSKKKKRPPRRELPDWPQDYKDRTVGDCFAFVQLPGPEAIFVAVLRRLILGGFEVSVRMFPDGRTTGTVVWHRSNDPLMFVGTIQVEKQQPCGEWVFVHSSVNSLPVGQHMADLIEEIYGQVQVHNLEEPDD